MYRGKSPFLRLTGKKIETVIKIETDYRGMFRNHDRIMRVRLTGKEYYLYYNTLHDLCKVTGSYIGNDYYTYKSYKDMYDTRVKVIEFHKEINRIKNKVQYGKYV